MRISDEQINEIREKADIVDFINVYVPLKKTGKNYKGLCPFHEEKTPSFVVSPDKQIYHCFGCGAGGNIFTFVRQYKNVSFIEAVKEVAEFIGIKLEFEENVSEKLDKNEKYYAINNFAQKHFAKILQESEHAKSVREYLKQRDIKTHTQKTFGLGYALPARDAFLKTLERNKINLDDVTTLGLIDKDQQGRYYDKFRGRLIFPIHTTNGRIAGFGGRILQSGAQTAKYINSPESPIYSKRKILYGLYFAKEEIRRLGKAILVEGYMDVISLYQNGIKNVVAASGTSLTEEQARLLSRYAKSVVVIFDADEAGERAAKRSIEILLKAHFDVRLLTLPEGEDPDSYIKSHTPDDFRDLVNSAKDFLSFQAAQFEKQGKLADPVSRTEAIRELVKSVALVEDELMRANYLSTLSANFNIKEKLLEDELLKLLNKEKTRKNYAERKTKERAESVRKVVSGRANLPFEKTVIKLLFSGNMEVVGEVFDHINPDVLQEPNLREIAAKLYDAYMDDVIEPSLLFDMLDENLRNIAAEIVMSKEPISEKWGTIDEEQSEEGLLKLTRDFIRAFQLQNIETQLAQISKELEETEDEAEKLKLLEEIQELLQEKKQLTKPDDVPF